MNFVTGLLEAVGKEATRHRSDSSDLKENEVQGLASSYSPAASSHASSGHASSKATPLLLASYRLRTGSDPVLNGGGERPLSSLPDPLGRPDPSSRLEAGVGKGGGAPPAEEGKMATKGEKLSPRLG